MVPWYSGISGDAPVLGKARKSHGAGGSPLAADADKVRKMREEFEGASAEYRVLSQVALAGLTSEGESLQKRFKDLEQAWGAFQWNQKTGHTDVISTRQEVQAASAALSGHGVGLDLEQEVETVLAELWDTLERPPAKPVKEAEEPLVAEELDRLEAFIEARIHEERSAWSSRGGTSRARHSGRRRPSSRRCWTTCRPSSNPRTRRAWTRAQVAHP
ncbi:unnamed protein product [Effrenium voratum]|nr:unnamed protein product [Effrenium voratum]